MTKESSNMIGQNCFLAFNLKLCVLNWGENTFFLRNQLMLHSGLFLIWQSVSDQPKAALASQRKFPPGHIESKVAVSGANLLWWLAPYKNSKMLIDSYKRYWW